MWHSLGRDPSESTLISTTIDDSTLGSHPAAGNVGITKCAFNICNVIIGSGIIGLPYALRQAGAVVGLLMLLVIGLLSNYTLRLLISVGRSVSCYDYEELTKHCFGQRGFRACLLTILLLDYGAMVTYIIVLGGTLPPVAAQFFGATGVLANRDFLLIVTGLVFMLPLCLLRSLKELSYVSVVSVLVMLVVIVIVGVEGLGEGNQAEGTVEMVGTQIFSSFGTIVFAYVCHDVSFQVFQTLSIPTEDRWSLVVHCAIFIALVASVLMGLLGYFSFGHLTEPNILDSFLPTNKGANVGRLALAVTLFFTYPVNLFMCRHILARVLGFASARELNTKGHVVTTLVLFATSLLIGLVFPNLGFVQSLVGGLSGAAVAYVIPAACAIKVRHMDQGIAVLSWANVCELPLLVFGVVVMCLSVGQTIYDAANGDSP